MSLIFMAFWLLSFNVPCLSFSKYSLPSKAFTRIRKSHIYTSVPSQDSQDFSAADLLGIFIALSKSLESLQNVTTKQGENIDLLKNTTISLQSAQNITNAQLKELIGYNQNRDSELECVLLSSFRNHLRMNDWEEYEIEVKNIYEPDGRVITKWDGIIFAVHPSMKYPIIFFGDKATVYLSKV